ncbi:Uncharacterized protein HZ326_6714 [Fusarium oxysporum f. sp. albedinis]|nr:Uncharacterized protein HZ326_6714 [Fusarium oxysporum f. sp. albedinis]
MARRKILFCFSICLEISLPPEITPQLISFLNSSSSPSQCYHTSPQQGIKVHHLDVPNSERLSRCDRILGAACVKRRALKKLELVPIRGQAKRSRTALHGSLWFGIMEHPSGLEEPFAASPPSVFRSSSSTSNIG